MRQRRQYLWWTTLAGPLLLAIILFGENATQSRPAAGPAATPTALAAARDITTPSAGPSPTVSPRPVTPAPTPPPATAPAPPAPAPPPPPPGPAPAAAPEPAAPRQLAGQNTQLAQQLIALVNNRRAQAHLPPVAQSGPLMAAAEGYASLHFAIDPYHLNHTLDGAPNDRAERQGYVGGIGEVLAESPPSAQEILNIWMSSPPHAAILTDPHDTDIGMGCHEGPSADGSYQIALCVGMLGYR